jgi:hypothetical protein
MDMIGNTPEINQHQTHYVSWIATPEEGRDPKTEIGLTRRLKIDRTTLWRWKKDPYGQEEHNPGPMGLSGRL